MEIITVSNNRKRSYDLEVHEKLDKLILIPEKSWGDNDEIPVISFDFQ